MTLPYPHQRVCSAAIEAFGGNALLALDMGTGKSYAALLWAKRNPDVRPIVIACPASVKYGWQRECKLHFGWSAEVLEGTKPTKFYVDKSKKIFIVNYDILRHWLPFLKKLKPKLLILDEIHMVANHTAKRSKGTKELAVLTPYRIGLSGTPILNRPVEIWHPVHLIKPRLFPSRFNFCLRYCGAKRTPWAWDFRGASHLKELRQILTKNVMVRMLTEDILKGMPSKRHIVVPLTIAKPNEYRRAVNDFLGWLARQSQAKALRAKKASQITKLGYLLRLAANLKMKSVLEWIDSFLADSNEKLVVFAVHHLILDELQNHYGRKCLRVDGNVSSKNRQLMVERFQRNDSKRLFLGQLKAAGQGLDGLQRVASNVALVEFGWTPGGVAQAIKRVHRIGSKKKVTAYFLVAHNTAEEGLCKLLQKKQRVVNAVLDGKGTVKLDIYDELTRLIKKEVGP